MAKKVSSAGIAPKSTKEGTSITGCKGTGATTSWIFWFLTNSRYCSCNRDSVNAVEDSVTFSSGRNPCLACTIKYARNSFLSLFGILLVWNLLIRSIYVPFNVLFFLIGAIGVCEHRDRFFNLEHLWSFQGWNLKPCLMMRFVRFQTCSADIKVFQLNRSNLSARQSGQFLFSLSCWHRCFPHPHSLHPYFCF